MKTQTVGIVVVIALIIGGAVGYSFGASGSMPTDNSKELQDSIVMMKEQSATIKQMSEAMKSGGMMMQEMGTTYKNDTMMNAGKDWEMMSTKYTTETKAAENTSGMNQMMNQ